MRFYTAAYRNVVGNTTFGIDSTCSRTRIDTLVTKTALFARAVCIQNTFWSARAIRISNVVGGTDATKCIVLLVTKSVRSTG